MRLDAAALEYRVADELGKGGQGAVYRCVPLHGGTPLALKWYRADTEDGRLEAQLRRVQRLEPPSGDFLWPIDLVHSPGDPGFGYVMPVRREGAVPLPHVLNGLVAMRLRAQCVAGARLAQTFLRLHARGLCYADVSANNLFVDPVTGEVQVCDNDNVVVDGSPVEVLGTPSFMAPEIVRREADPSALTDRHSLSVILYMLLVRAHPLFGRRESAERVLDGESLTRLLGLDPVFAFDPEDESNRPLADAGNAVLLWPMLPGFARRLFVDAFTNGLRDPRHGRVTETAWRVAFMRLRALVRTCAVCGAEQFLDPDRPGEPCVADDCRAPLDPPLVLRGRRAVVLEPGTQLLQSDLGAVEHDADSLVGDVVAHPGTGALALRNRSTGGWTVGDRDPAATVPPRSAFVLVDGQRLRTPAAERSASIARAS